MTLHLHKAKNVRPSFFCISGRFFLYWPTISILDKFGIGMMRAELVIYTQYIKKHKTYIFFSLITAQFKDEHFKIVRYFDWNVCCQ